MARGTTAKRILKYFGLTLLFIVLIGYGLARGRDLIFGINLTVNGISDNQTVSSSTIDLSGTAKHSSGISINGRQISVTEDGNWQDTLALLPGVNIVQIVANDKFGRSISKVFTINYSAPPS